jgi:hypothetical protein
LLSNNDAQEAVIDYLQANAAILALHSNFPVEIREEYWQAEKFVYPNIRVACEITPAIECGPDECFAKIISNSEEKSSKQSQAIAGTIANELHEKTFTQNNIRFSSIRVQKVFRAEQDGGIWRTVVNVLMDIK